MIDRAEIEARAQRDGVPDQQVWRDWIISHALHALGTIQHETPITFYGGTALCRTWCPDLRYSEDIDLLAAEFDDAIEVIPARLRRLLRREFSDLEWSPAPTRDRMVTGSLMTSGRSIKMQLVEPRGREADIPVARTAVAMRYSDLPAIVELNVPTRAGFAAMKLMAWHQRQAPRDLIDLAALAGIGAITSEALDLTNHVSGTRIGPRVLDQALTPAVTSMWKEQLGHQMRQPPDAQQCLDMVVDAARRADG